MEKWGQEMKKWEKWEKWGQKWGQVRNGRNEKWGQPPFFVPISPIRKASCVLKLT